MIPPNQSEKENGINVKLEYRQAVIRVGRVKRALSTAERNKARLAVDVVALYGSAVAAEIEATAYDD